MSTSIVVRDMDPGTSPGCAARPGRPGYPWKNWCAV